MRPNISEFSFGYVLTSELLNYYKLMATGAPVFPSLTAEGTLGYDVNLPLHGFPVFLQFKLSHFMIRPNAIGSELMPPPHYRMPLRPLKHSEQHNLLLKLEARGHEVFYAAPEFHEPRELNDAYSSNTVVRRSAFFRPKAIGVLPDPEEHFVLFARATRKAYRLSEPLEIDRQDGHSFFLERLLSDVKNQEVLGPERLRALGDELVTVWEQEAGVFPESVVAIRRAQEDRDPGDFLSYVSRTLFDSEVLFVVHERSGSSSE